MSLIFCAGSNRGRSEIKAAGAALTAMKILMVTFQFPPVLDPETICTGKLVRALLERGVDLTVATVATLSYQRLDDSPSWKQDLGKVRRFSPPRYSHSLVKFAARMRGLEPRSSVFYAKPIALQMKRWCRQLLETESFDLLLTRSLPADSIAVGAYLRRHCRVKWVASLDDPYPGALGPPPYGQNRAVSLRERYQAKWLRRALARADQVIFPSWRLGLHMEKKLGISLASRMRVIPHIGWKASPRELNPEGLEILHAGSVGLPRVNQAFLDRICQAVQNYPSLKNTLRISFLGTVDSGFRNYLQSRYPQSQLRFEAPVCYEDSLKRIAQATALLLMEGSLDNGIYLPSKFCDYSVSEKPLLLFCPESGTVADLVGGYQHPGFLGQDEKHYGPRIDRFLARLAQGQNLKDYAYPRPQEFEARPIVDQLLSIL